MPYRIEFIPTAENRSALDQLVERMKKRTGKHVSRSELINAILEEALKKTLEEEELDSLTGGE